MCYTCESCRYAFEYKDKPERCPDCGDFNVRLATEREFEEYKKFRAEFEKEVQA